MTLALLLMGLAVVTGVSAGPAGASTAASHTIASAGPLTVGDTESGGGGQVDFWKVTLAGGDKVGFRVSYPSGNSYDLGLYAPGTDDLNFLSSTSFSHVELNGTASAAVLQAPYNGTFILAVCENAYLSSCSSGDSTNPMYPYTFTTTETGGQSRTYLSLSAHTIRYHHERGLKFHVHVVSVDGGMPAGLVRVSDGTKTVCMVRLVRGSGTCSPPANTKIGVGKYWIRACYHGGNRHNSVSGRTRLTVTHYNPSALRFRTRAQPH